MSADVYQFPTRALTRDDVAAIRAMFTAKPLTRAQLAMGPIEEIRTPGPWISPPDSELSESLMRVQAIIIALVGPGRVPLAEGLDVAIELLAGLRQGVPT